MGKRRGHFANIGACSAVIALALLTLAVSAQQNRSGSRALAISHVGVIDTNAGTVKPDMTVIVQDGRIVSVDRSTAVRAPSGAEIVDGRGKFLIPGLWDMHVHLSYARVSALPALVANGVTNVRDMGSDLAEIDRWRAQIADNTLVGPTIIRAGPMLNGKEFNRYQLEVDNEAEARTAVRTLQKVGVDFIKLHRRTSREAYFAIADEAKKIGLPFTGHVPVTVSPGEASDAGQASIEHTATLFEGTFATDYSGKDQAAEIARWRATDASALFTKFVRNGTFVDPTLVAQEYLVRRIESGSPDPNDRYIAASARQEADKTLVPEAKKSLLESKAVLREMRAVTALMNRAGVILLAGTDLSYLHPPGFVLHDELALLVESGLSAAEALRTATLNPARLLRLPDAGIIAPNARADLVLLDGNPLDDIRNTQRIRAVVLRGKYFNRGSLDGLLDEAARRAATN
jgi:imidazolonepropionase-like amidohydrolase